MPRVEELLPGDVIENAGTRAMYIAQGPHPAWRNLRLVIWRMQDGNWSFDALSPGQYVGQYVPPVDHLARAARLHDAGILPSQAVERVKAQLPSARPDARVAEDPEAWAWQ